MNDFETTTIIPAAPGWFALWQDEDTGELCAADPVLAWLFIRDQKSEGHGLPPAVSTYPVGTDGTFDNDYFLLRPDGKVEGPIGERWSSLETANAPDVRAKRVPPCKYCDGSGCCACDD